MAGQEDKRARSGARRSSPPAARRRRPAAVTARRPPSLEHRILVTTSLCLLAFGAVMVYSASSPLSVLRPHGGGAGTTLLVRYLIAGIMGLGLMQLLSKHGLNLLTPQVAKLMVIGSLVLLVAVLLPGLGRGIQGSRRWFAVGPIQFQPSELMKLSLIVYVARYLADHPKRLQSVRMGVGPIALVAGPACLLILIEPDMGTALVVTSALAAMLVAAGMPMRKLAVLAAVACVVVMALIVLEPYRAARLGAFLNPWSSANRGGAGYQPVQGQIALGSGGLFGVGLGRSVEKLFYLPEANSDFILAVVGEEVGLVGICSVICLYGLIAYAGLRTARRASSRYAKLLASGLTSLILCQGLLNIFVVLGLAPLTGVPLPFISYAPTNLLIMLASVGVLLNIASPAARLRVVDSPRRDTSADRDRRRRDGRARGAGSGGGRRAAG